MNWFKRNLPFGTVLFFCLAALVVEAWLLPRYQKQAARALASLEQKKQDRDKLIGQTPALSDENEQAITRDRAHAGSVLAELRAALRGGDGNIAIGATPSRPIDVYFDLAGFVEKTRTSAARAGVNIKPDEHFGFASHASEGPGVELIPAVYRQRVAGQSLVEALLEARPCALLAIQREHPLTAGQRAQRDKPAPVATAARAEPVGGVGQLADFFDFDGKNSVRAAGRVDSNAFRLEFTGQTAVLRAFLNNLAASGLPAFVRSVEVEPLAPESLATDPAVARPPAGPVPLVTPSLSKFSVVVEVIETAFDPENPAS